MRKCF
jgi:hypothetical protein